MFLFFCLWLPLNFLSMIIVYNNPPSYVILQNIYTGSNNLIIMNKNTQDFFDNPIKILSIILNYIITYFLYKLCQQRKKQRDVKRSLYSFKVHINYCLPQYGPAVRNFILNVTETKHAWIHVIEYKYVVKNISLP